MSQVLIFQDKQGPTFPRERNGTVDNGERLSGPLSRDKCPSCKSPNYFETVSTEHCKDCGLFYDYWFGPPGGNSVYQAYLAKKRAEEAAKEYLRELQGCEE